LSVDFKEIFVLIDVDFFQHLFVDRYVFWFELKLNSIFINFFYFWDLRFCSWLRWISASESVSQRKW
jgi:hypothetical protein